MAQAKAELKLRSDAMKKGMSRAPARGLMRATGMKDEDFEKPLVAIANSYNTIVPGQNATAHMRCEDVDAPARRRFHPN